MKILKDIRFFMVVATLSLTGLLVIHLNCLDDLEKTKEELVKCQTDKGYIPGGDIENQRLKEQKDRLEVELNVQNMINSNLSNNWEILREINPILADSIDNQTE
jgi:hypothetical protein